MNFGQRIAYARGLRNWNRSELARAIGLTPQAISRLEREADVPAKTAATTAVAIALATGVTTSWLVTGRGARLRVDMRSDAVARMADLMSQMTDAEQEALLRFAQWTLDQRPRSLPHLTLVPDQ